MTKFLSEMGIQLRFLSTCNNSSVKDLLLVMSITDLHMVRGKSNLQT